MLIIAGGWLAVALSVGSKVSWNDGTGDAQVTVKVSTGSITVHLD